MTDGARYLVSAQEMRATLFLLHLHFISNIVTVNWHLGRRCSVKGLWGD